MFYLSVTTYTLTHCVTNLITVLIHCSLENARKKNGRVLVHCVAGISRSVTVTMSYIMQEMAYSLNEAFDYVKQRKSDISPNFGFMGQLLEFQKKLKQKELAEGLPSVTANLAYQKLPSCVELCAR